MGMKRKSEKPESDFSEVRKLFERKVERLEQMLSKEGKTAMCVRQNSRTLRLQTLFLDND